MANFKSRVEHLGGFYAHYEDHDIRKEPMLYSCDVPHAMQYGGEITKMVLKELAPKLVVPEGYNAIIDTKTIMLMPGMYPCIGGWHADSIERGENGQPIVTDESLNTEQEHYIFQISEDTGSQTAYLDRDITIPDAFIDPKAVWKSVSSYINMADPDYSEMVDGYLYKFNSSCLHKGQPARQAGWRYFFRLSFMKSAPANEIRTQVNVYTDINAGW